MARNLLTFWFIFLTACVGYDPYARYPQAEQGAAPAPTVSPDQINEVLEYVDRVSEEASTGEPDDKTYEPESPKSEPKNEITETIAHIPVEINDDVKRWIEFFTVRDRERFERFLERGEKFRPMIQEVLKDQGLPMDLYYLALIESGFSEQAVSRASAVGVWQFIKATGKRYGLRVDGFVDERRDPMRATIAASLYLNDLHNVFQSWYLAMAAYNAGEMRIMTAIMKGNSRNFWELVQMKKLPKETMNYIPKFLAAVIIGHNPEHYGFKNVAGQAHPRLVLAQVPSPIKLIDIAKVTGIPHSDLKRFNPHLLRGATPGDAKNYRIWVPKGMQHLLKDHEPALARLRFQAPKQAVAHKGKGIYHRVRPGENLTTIAARYRTSIGSLRAMNNLKTNQVNAGALLRVASFAGRNAMAQAEAEARSYRVRRGDNLDKISRRFKISIPQLKKMNDLKRNTIYVGQLLKLADNSG